MKTTDGRKILKNVPAWQSVTWEGAERLMLQKSAEMTFRERLMWLEEAAKLSSVIRNARKKPLKEILG
jgi:hypothetical protein